MKLVVLICIFLLYPLLLYAQEPNLILDSNIFDRTLLKKVSTITVYDSVNQRYFILGEDSSVEQHINKTDTFVYEVDKKGRVREASSGFYTKSDSLVFNKFGNVQFRYSFSNDGSAYLSLERIPDSLGNIIAEVKYYRRHNGTSRSDTTQFYQYHKNGALKESFNPGMDDTITRLYDTLGRMVQETYKYHSHIRWVKYCYWNENGTEMEEEYTHPQENTTTTIKCHRYKNGKETEMVSTGFFRWQNSVDRDTAYWTYDDRGFLLTKYKDRSYTDVTYNSHGLPESIIRRSANHPEVASSVIRYKYTFRM